MTDVSLRHITKQFPHVAALKDLSFTIQTGEFFVLLGPTGAGKTTTLRIISGLERQTDGDVVFDDEVINDFPPADRDVAFVFQQYSLYPTMTVYDNLAFPLRSPMRRVPNDQIKARVHEVAEKLRISHLLDRRCSNLSGGEMQRVSIGRAIVRTPRIYLMDEPLSNLDAKLREALRVELQHLQKTQKSTTLFVTHDQIEALTLADRIGVLVEGRLVQVGTPNEIYDQPANTYVAQMVGTPRINLLEAERVDGHIQISHSPMQLSAANADLPARFLFGVRPEDVLPDPGGEFTGEVILTEPLGVETILHIRINGATILSLIPGMSPLRIGDTTRFDIKRDRLHYFSTDGIRLPATHKETIR